jgi:signal transduction histidine kinase
MIVFQLVLLIQITLVIYILTKIERNKLYPGLILVTALILLTLERGIDLFTYSHKLNISGSVEAIFGLFVTITLYYLYKDQNSCQLALQKEIMRKEQESHQILVNMEMLLKNLEIGSWIWEANTEKFTFDLKARSITGLPETICLKSLLKIVHTQDYETVRQYLKKGKDQRSEGCELRIWKEGKICHIKLLADSLGRFNSRGLLLTGVLIDLTDQHLQKQALQESKEELEQRNSEMEVFLHIAAHDLQEPLRKIIYYCQRLLSDDNLGNKSREYAKWAAEGSQRMQQLIMDLSDYSKAGNTISSTNFSLSEIVGVAYSNLLVSIEENHAIVTLISDVPIQGDRNLWEQLIQNLLNNAIKYHRENESPVIKISGTVEEEKVFIRVEDNGIGIPWEYKDRIFEPFKRLHTRTKYFGTGMGLALCKRIVEKHQGRIWLEKSTDAGSVFTIEVPRRVEP